MKRKNIISTLACSIAALAITACTDVWEEHYQPNPELNSDQTLWDVIEGDDELTEFAKFLHVTGYDTLLQKNRYYTVWAPTNDAEFFKTHSAKDAEGDKALRDEYRKELVENHIADYGHVAGGRLDGENLVKMLNGKYIHFDNASGAFAFKGIALKESNIPAKNGVLHKIDGYAGFTANIWEQLAKEESLSSLYGFLFKDYKREPNLQASVQGSYVDGKPEILDTAWTVTCPWFSSLGQLNREDSSYTMFALTNDAWEKMYDMAKEYFVYSADYGREGDSIQEAVVKELMCSNLVFSDKVNKKYANGSSEVPYDTLISNFNLFYTTDPLTFEGDEVKALYNGATTLPLSNGTLNIVDKVNYDPLKCWHDTIRVEGESLSEAVDRENSNAAYSEYRGAIFDRAEIENDSLQDYVSNGAVGVFSSEKDKPMLDFKIENVLSARYEVKAVVFPPQVIDPSDTLYIKPSKFFAKLTCASRDSKDGLGNPIALGRKESCELCKDTVYSDPTKIDTIDLVPLDAYLATGQTYVEIPVSEYLEATKLNGVVQTKLNITSCLGADRNNPYEFKDYTDYKALLSSHSEAIGNYNAKKLAYDAAYTALEALSGLETATEEEIKAAEKALKTALKDLEKAEEDMNDLKEEIVFMDENSVLYDNTLRIDQIILIPWNPNKTNE